jgi:LPS-assembly lipoprotein
MESIRSPYSRLVARWFAVIGLAFMLVACGFHLRGDFHFAFKSMYVETPGGSQILRIINRLNRGMKTTEIVNNPKNAEVILSISNERKKQKTLSYDNHGDAREYALYYRVTYSLRTVKGRELVAPTTITLRRTMTYDDSEDLAKEREKQMLYEDMQQDIAQQILRRLSRVTMEGLPGQSQDMQAAESIDQNENDNAQMPGGAFQIETDGQ